MSERGRIGADGGRRLRFGVFELHPDTGELKKDGRPIRLAPQPFRLLVLLARRAGELVTREDLRRELWGEDTHVAFDAGLNFCINQIRAVLGDDAAEPVFLETLPRRGYRFVASVEEEAAAGPARADARRSRARVSRAAFVGLALVAATLQLPGRDPNGGLEAEGATLIIRPLEAIGVEPRVAAFGAGVAEELAVRLSQWPSRRLRVITPGAAPVPTSGDRAPRGPASRAYVLRASVRADGDKVRIGVRLSHTADGGQIWADTFSLDPRAPGSTRPETRAGIVVARSVVQQVLPGPEAARPTTRSAAANALYLKGRMLWREENPALLGASAAAFQDAIATDPGYAAAYAGLADALNAQARIGLAPPAAAYARAKVAALRAVALAPGLSEGHAALGFVQLYRDFDWAAAERSLRTAVDLDPELPQAHQWYSAYLSAVGRHDGAVAQALAARELAPLSPGASFDLGRSYLFARRFDQSIDECSRALELEPRFSPAAWCLELAEAEMSSERRESRPAAVSELAAAERYALSERTAEALAALESAYAQRASGLVFLAVNPSYDPLRREPRFRALLDRLRWPVPPAERGPGEGGRPRVL